MTPKRTNLFVLTTARDTAEPFGYLASTIKNIEAQGPRCGYRAVVCDGPYAGPKLPGYDIIQFRDKSGSGNRDAWFKVFHIAADLGGAALCLEDDIEIAPGGMQKMIDFEVPGDLGAVQFFASKAVLTAKAPAGLTRAPLGTMRFLQATKYSRDALNALDLYRRHPEFLAEPSAGDEVVGRAMKHARIQYGIFSPVLVQHVGHTSKANKGAKLAWWRKADNFTTEMQLKDLDPNSYR